MNAENDMARGETIGRHLYNFAHMKNDPRVHDPAPDWDHAGSMTREMWRKLGRECLRQMEWATLKAEQRLRAELTGSHLFHGEIMTYLAPDDFKPECST